MTLRAVVHASGAEGGACGRQPLPVAFFIVPLAGDPAALRCARPGALGLPTYCLACPECGQPGIWRSYPCLLLLSIKSTIVSLVVKTLDPNHQIKDN